MRILENEQCFIRIRRNAAPARAREVVRSNSESLTVTDANSGSAASDMKRRVAELRARVRNGSYQADLKEVSQKLVQDHLDGRER